MGDVRQPGRVTFLIEQARETALREARDAVAASSWRQLYPYIVDELVVAIDALLEEKE